MKNMEWTATLPEDLANQTEWYRLDKRVQQSAYIKRLCRKIVEAFHPQKIILFGSRAYGKPREDSDIDLLVVMPYDGDHAKAAIQILNRLDVLAPIDLLVRSPEEVHERIGIGDRFMREIVERGKVIYDAAYAGMD
ncbi:MAG: nucleotidyltransferase domain-containing protein [Blastocatellia bacterium]